MGTSPRVGWKPQSKPSTVSTYGKEPCRFDIVRKRLQLSVRPAWASRVIVSAAVMQIPAHGIA